MRKIAKEREDKVLREREREWVGVGGSGREGGREGGRKRQGDILLVKDITKRTEKKGKLKEKVRKKKRERDYQKERKRRIK